MPVRRFKFKLNKPKGKTSGVGFTGSRDGMTKKQRETARNVIVRLLDRNKNVFRHGDCVRSDEEAHKIAKTNNAYIVIYPPEKSALRAFCEGNYICEPKEYIKRNHNIVDDSSIMVATPNSMDELWRSGTWATIRYAIKSGKPIHIIYPDGSLEYQNGLVDHKKGIFNHG